MNNHRKNRRRIVFGSTIVAAASAAAWLSIAACSSSTDVAPAAATGDGSPGGDELNLVRPPTDAGATRDVTIDALDTPCDPIKQDCADPSLRCQIIYSGGEYRMGCEPPWDPAVNLEGQVCSRTSPGHDDCVNGLSCLSDGVTATSCHRICAKDSDCAPGSRCGAITTIAPFYGLCWNSCRPFAGDCSDASTCAGPHVDNDQSSPFSFESCREVGAGELGSSCTAQYNCAADMNCQGMGGFKCKAMCDATHLCEAGTCTIFPGLPNAGGLCE
jgi:hypothetical protein